MATPPPPLDGDPEALRAWLLRGRRRPLASTCALAGFCVTAWALTGGSLLWTVMSLLALGTVLVQECLTSQLEALPAQVLPAYVRARYPKLYPPDRD